MTIWEAIFLGLIQGLTEFIPVSSSGHLVLLHHALGLEGGLAYDVALHIGTLAALLLIFWRDIGQLIGGLLGRNEHSRLAWLIALATVPAVISGTLLQRMAESTFRSVELVSFNLILVALLMIAAEHVARRVRHPTGLQKITPTQALAVGVGQALAVIPGVSRSGGTITAGLFAGIDRIAATRFSFLLAIPITLGAILKVLSSGSTPAFIRGESSIFAAGVLTAFLSGMFAIKFMLSFLARHSLHTFAYYRIVLGLVTLLLAGLR